MATSSPASVLWIRWLLGILALNMIVLSACLLVLGYLTWTSQRSVSSACDVLLVVWMAALLVGGVCGVIAALNGDVGPARRMFACWVLSSTVHAYFLVMEQASALHSETSYKSTSDWLMTMLPVLTDMLISFLMARFLAVLQVHGKSGRGKEHAELQPLLPIQGNIAGTHVRAL